VAGVRGMTKASRSRAANATFWSTQLVNCWLSSSPPLPYRIEMVPSCYSPDSAAVARSCVASGWMAATVATF
jgi:hypothetical protein